MKYFKRCYRASCVYDFADIGDLAVANAQINTSKTLCKKRKKLFRAVALGDSTRIVEIRR